MKPRWLKRHTRLRYLTIYWERDIKWFRIFGCGAHFIIRHNGHRQIGVLLPKNRYHCVYYSGPKLTPRKNGEEA